MKATTMEEMQGVEAGVAGYKEDSQELLTLVDELIDDLTGKLDTVSNEIKAKMDDMARRLDNLEASLLPQREPSGEAS